MGFDAFESISAPYIGKIYADGVHLEHSRTGEEAAAPFELKNKLCTDVFLMKLIPGPSRRFLTACWSWGTGALSSRPLARVAPILSGGTSFPS